MNLQLILDTSYRAHNLETKTSIDVTGWSQEPIIIGDTAYV
jgi:hypothetical protein